MGEGLLDFLQFAARAQRAYRQSDRQTERYANLLVCNWKAAKRAKSHFTKSEGLKERNHVKKVVFEIENSRFRYLRG